MADLVDLRRCNDEEPHYSAAICPTLPEELLAASIVCQSVAGTAEGLHPATVLIFL